MKFNIKAIVAAVALVTASSAAHAVTNNQLFLVAYDAVTQKTFAAALGPQTVSGFAPSSDLSFDFSANANWTSFTSAVGYSAADVQYQVLGFNIGNTATAGAFNSADKLLVTSNATPGTFTNSGMNNLILDASVTSGTIGGFFNTNSALTGTGTALISGTGADSGNAVGSAFFTKYPALTSTATLGSALNFYAITRPVATTNLTQTVKTALLETDNTTLAYWNLSSLGALSYTMGVAAVPEADTSAMMIVGFGVMAAVARRRKNASNV